MGREMVDKLRVGIVGTGGIARGQHIPGYLRRSDAEITMFCDVNEAALKSMGDAYGVRNLTTDFRELVTSDIVDAVSVCTSNDMHYPVTMAAIEAGKHVLCEKPLGVNYGQTREMYEAAKAKGIVAGVGFVHRCTPSSRLAQRIISSGGLGEIYHVIAIYSSGGGPGSNFPLVWRRQKEYAGAGVSWDLGAHMVDMTRWWLGQEITAVSARLETFVKEARLLSGEGMGKVTTDDASSFLADFEGGAIGTFINTNHFTARGFDQRIEVYGSKGAIRYDQDRPYELQAVVGDDMMRLFAVRGIERPEPYPWVPVPMELRDKWPKHTLTPDFVAAIRGESDFLPTFYDGMRVQEVLDALLLSNEERRWVSLPLAVN
jgi:predicted dehydrogenase